jgi:tRNA modification GTPase
MLVASELLGQSTLDPALAAIELREALDALGEIPGRVDTEDLLGVIFSRFCIGK